MMQLVLDHPLKPSFIHHDKVLIAQNHHKYRLEKTTLHLTSPTAKMGTHAKLVVKGEAAAAAEAAARGGSRPNL